VVAGHVSGDSNTCFPSFDLLVSAGNDIDGDGLRSCEDSDDDGDNLTDEQDPCPQGAVPFALGKAGSNECSYSASGTCPIANPDAFRACQTRGCFELIDRRAALVRPFEDRIRRPLRERDVRVRPNLSGVTAIGAGR
jgi:hypothetical protein